MLNYTFISHQYTFDIIRIILICWLLAITISRYYILMMTSSISCIF